MESGASAMEQAVISRGGRVPEAVAVDPSASMSMTGGHNIISASYIAAVNSPGHNHNRCGGQGLSSSGMSAVSGWWGSTMGSGMGGGGGVHDGKYTYMDEEYLRCLQAHVGWERDNEIIHLMPIAVVYQEEVC